jgi:glycosyltransferase involved in cell wall biosynthesis
MDNNLVMQERTKKKYSIVVIIPMYNSSETIKRALSSVANQSLPANRVIVIDDGSIDNSCKIVRGISSNFPIPLDLITQINSGPSSARNAGILKSTEDLVCFLDSDDEWIPKKLEKQVELYNLLVLEGKRVGIIDCFMRDISAAGIVIKNTPVLNGYHFKDFLVKNVIKGTPCVMIPREVFSEVGMFNENLRFSEDRMLWSYIAEKYEIFTVEDVLVNRYFGTDGNITSNINANYQLKKEFSMFFTKEFENKLTKNEIVCFKLHNLREFLTAFYKAKDYKKVIMCYQDMLAVSLSTIWIDGFYPTLKFLISYILQFKAVYNGK